MIKEHGWISTFTGKRFYPLDPTAGSIDIVDIAHALSNICRFTGHVDRFYSVAQHCVVASRHAPSEKLAVLLHDASEAYLCDIARPVKHDPEMNAYRIAEKRLMALIESVFTVDCDHPVVHAVDNRMLLTEKRDLMARSGPWGNELDQVKPYPERIIPWGPNEAEGEFLYEFHRLNLLH